MAVHTLLSYSLRRNCAFLQLSSAKFQPILSTHPKMLITPSLTMPVFQAMGPASFLQLLKASHLISIFALAHTRSSLAHKLSFRIPEGQPG